MTEKTNMAEDATEIFELKLEFDTKTGALISVVQLGANPRVPEEHIDLVKLTNGQMKKATSHSMIFSYGSPGCITFKVRGGYITVC